MMRISLFIVFCLVLGQSLQLCMDPGFLKALGLDPIEGMEPNDVEDEFCDELFLINDLCVDQEQMKKSVKNREMRYREVNNQSIEQLNQRLPDLKNRVSSLCEQLYKAYKHNKWINGKPVKKEWLRTCNALLLVIKDKQFIDIKVDEETAGKCVDYGVDLMKGSYCYLASTKASGMVVTEIDQKSFFMEVNGDKLDSVYNDCSSVISSGCFLIQIDSLIDSLNDVENKREMPVACQELNKVFKCYHDTENCDVQYKYELVSSFYFPDRFELAGTVLEDLKDESTEGEDKISIAFSVKEKSNARVYETGNNSKMEGIRLISILTTLVSAFLFA